MKSLVIIAVALSGAFAQASEGISAMNLESSTLETSADVLNMSSDISATTSSRFNTVLSWFSQGHAMRFADFKGFHAGRCFARNNQDKPLAAMIGYYQERTSSDAGPGFIEQNPPKIQGLLGNYAIAPEFFDNEASFERNKADFNLKVPAVFAKTSNYVEYPTLSFTFDWENNGNPDERHEFVTYQNYIIQKWTAAFPQKYGDFGRLTPGDVIYMCYYFKKLGE